MANLSENALTLSDGNEQTVMIEQQDIAPNGTFFTNFQVTATQSENFTVSFNLQKNNMKKALIQLKIRCGQK